MPKTLINIWRWISHTDTAISMLGWLHWLLAAFVSGAAVLTAWLRQIDPIWWVLIGFSFFALTILVFERISARRHRRQSQTPSPATDEIAEPSDDHWADRRKMELMALANVASGRASTAGPMSGEPENSYYHVLKEAVEDGRLKAKRTGTLVDYAAEVEYDDFCRFVDSCDIPWVQELRVKWSSKHSKTTTNSPSAVSRISLTDLMRDAENIGWCFTDDGGQHIFDFVRALRDAGSTKDIQFFGRNKQQIEAMTKEHALSDIDPKYWRKFKIDGISCLDISYSNGETQGIASDNLNTTTVADGNLTKHGLYADIHLNRVQAVSWLRSQTIIPARISMAEAVVQVYEQTQGGFAAQAAERLSNGDIEGWYAAAITKDGDVTLYGCRPPSRVPVEISQSDLQAFMFKDGANELVDQFDEHRKYVNLEIFTDDLTRKIEELKSWQ